MEQFPKSLITAFSVLYFVKCRSWRRNQQSCSEPVSGEQFKVLCCISVLPVLIYNAMSFGDHCSSVFEEHAVCSANR